MQHLRIVVVLVVMFFLIPGIYAFDRNKDEDIIIPVGNVKYVFGPEKGLYRILDTSNEELYTFGDNPCWFMLTYLHQTASPSKSIAEYYYPQIGEEPYKNLYDWERDDVNPNIIRYFYEFKNLPGESGNYLCDGDQCTHVTLEFQVYTEAPLDGVTVTIAIENHALDSQDELRRLMDIHCPFVRMPKIGSTGENDVFLMGDFLLRDPIRNYGLNAEPWEIAIEESEERTMKWVHDQQYYPKGFPVWAYYDEDSGAGLYFALYNLERKTCQTNLYKHQSGVNYTKHNWDTYIGPEESGNWPTDRDYMIWDVVRYAEDVSEPENDYPNHPEFCCFLKFFEEEFDYYDVADRYRETLQLIQAAYNSNGNFFGLLDTLDPFMNYWPENTVRESILIPEWVKY